MLNRSNLKPKLMKKFYLLLSAACVVLSASAVEKEMIASKSGAIKAQTFRNVAAPQKATLVKGHKNVAANGKKVAKKADAAADDYCFFMPAENIGSIGMSQTGSGFSGLGFASSYGDLVFYNYSTNVASYSWQYSELNGLVDGEWDYQYTDAETLAVKSGVGEVAAPSLDVKFASGDDGYYEINTKEYLCGAGANYWVGLDDDGTPFGITAYQNAGLRNPKNYTGSSTYMMAYEPNGKGYDANGVYVDKEKGWQVFFQQRYGKTASDMVLNNFTFIQPAPASTYFITQGWAWFSVEVNAATQLMSYIYPIDEDGAISDIPIALGYASISKEGTDNPVFYYNPLNEDGDELEGEVYIDSAVAITIEGFAGNDAITSCYPVSGFYPFSYKAYSANDYANADICKDPTVYAEFSLQLDGEPAVVYGYDNGLYYYNQNTLPNGAFVDDDTLSLLDYGQFMTDATFNFIYTSDGSDVVNLPKEGGNVDVALEALYYVSKTNIEDFGAYEITAPDWVTVTVKDPNKDTGESIINVACEAGDDRSGILTISGLGVSLDLTVNQGEGAGVQVVTDNGVAKYYDLAGRRVVNPEKGIYVKVSGNKAEKVAL